MRKETYYSALSLVSLLVACAAGYWTFDPNNTASDELKYAGIGTIILAIVLCSVLVRQGLRAVGLTISDLRSIKVCVVVSFLQTLLASVYGYDFLYPNPPMADYLFDPRVLAALVACLLAAHGYTLYVNLRQTRLVFLSLTVSLAELAASTATAAALLLYQILKVSIAVLGVFGRVAAVAVDTANQAPMPHHPMSTKTYSARIRLPSSRGIAPPGIGNYIYQEISVQADSIFNAQEILEHQYGKESVMGIREVRR